MFESKKERILREAQEINVVRRKSNNCSILKKSEWLGNGWVEIDQSRSCHRRACLLQAKTTKMETNRENGLFLQIKEFYSISFYKPEIIWQETCSQVVELKAEVLNAAVGATLWGDPKRERTWEAQYMAQVGFQKAGHWKVGEVAGS